MFEKLKVVSGFQGVDEHRKLVASVAKEKDIKSRIKELLRYRKNGISALSEAESYEPQRLKRNKRKAERKKALESGVPIPGSDFNTSFPSDASPVKEETKKVDLDKLASIIGLPGKNSLQFVMSIMMTFLTAIAALYVKGSSCFLSSNLFLWQ